MNQPMNELKVMEVSVEDIIPNRFQPRLVFDEPALKELSMSIREHGIFQPLVVRQIGDKYEIIAGERRYKASILAGLKKVPVIVMELNDQQSAEVAVVENLQRRDLSPLEEAKSYKKLLNNNMTQEELASRMGKTQATIANKLRLLSLDPIVQEALLNDKISERHARSLLSLKDPANQRKVLGYIMTNKLTVKQTDDIIKGMTGAPPIEDFSINTSPIIGTENMGTPVPFINTNPSVTSVNNPINENYSTTKPDISPAPTVIPSPKEDPIINTNPSVTSVNNLINENYSTTKQDVSPAPTVIPSPREEPVLSTFRPTADMTLPEIQIKDPTINMSELVGEPYKFVDVDRIKSEATDIHVDKPIADISSLLKTEREVQQPISSIEENRISPMPTLPPEKPKNRFLPSLEDEETNMDLFDEELDIPEMMIDPLAMLHKNDIPIPTVQDTPSPTSSTQLTESRITPVVQPISSVSSESYPNPVVTQPPTSEPTFVPEPEVLPKVSSNEFVTGPLVQVPESVQSIQTSSPTAIPVQPTPIISYEAKPATFYNIPAVYEEEEEKPKPLTPSYGYTMKDAISTVREATKKIESNGFVLDLDEYDMDNEYQITIHINKPRV